MVGPGLVVVVETGLVVVVETELEVVVDPGFDVVVESEVVVVESEVAVVETEPEVVVRAEEAGAERLGGPVRPAPALLEQPTASTTSAAMPAALHPDPKPTAGSLADPPTEQPALSPGRRPRAAQA